MTDFERIVAKHIERYSQRLVAGLRGGLYAGAIVNKEECVTYLALWINILAKGGKNLDPEERAEYDDALEDERA